MRNISPTSLAKIASQYGAEPILTIEVSWNDFDIVIYADRAFPGAGTNTQNIEGRILNVSTIDDTLNFAKSNTNQHITITLADTQGDIKYRFDNTDIHHRPVSIFQWFSDIPYSERFLLFKGTIASPIVWSESQRTLTFDILSRVDDREVGFSIEDGFFPVVPQTMVGKAWPLIFGEPAFVPALLADEIPHGTKMGTAADSVLKNPYGIHDPAIDKQLQDDAIKIAFARGQALIDFIGYLQASFTARKNGELSEFADISTGKGPFSKLAQQFLAQGNALLKQATDIQTKDNDLLKTLRAQKGFESNIIGATNGNNFPQNTVITLEINGATVTGYFVGDNFTVLSATHPNDEITAGTVIDPLDTRIGEPVLTRNLYFFADGGTPLQNNQTLTGETLATLLLNPPPTPVRYILALGVINLQAVYAYRTVNNYRSIYPVPASYYIPSIVDFGGGIVASILYLPQPLSAWGQGWEDEIWHTSIGAVGPNIVDIMTFLIQTYTIFNIDAASFSAARTQLDPYPANFAILDRPNIIKLLQDMAYQCRCVIYLKDDTFFIKNLAIADTPVDTITENDIIHQSLSLETTETEDLTTKYIAKWRADYLNRNTPELIFRYNQLNYGLHEKTVNFFLYNNQATVARMATFWLIREANAFKILKFKTPITKLKIESLDTITLNFSHPYIANGPIDGVVQSAVFNSSDFTIDFTVWCPVRLGEMINYAVAYPGSISEQIVFPSENDIITFKASASNATYPPSGVANKPFTGPAGNGKTVVIGPHKSLNWGNPDTSDSVDTSTGIIGTQVVQGSVKTLPNNQKDKYGKPVNTTNYGLSKQTVTNPTPTAAQTGGNSTFPAVIKTVNMDGTYDMYIFQKGTFGNNPPFPSDATSVETVRQIDVENTDVDFEVGTACMATKVQFTDNSGNQVTEWYTQIPVWG